MMLDSVSDVVLGILFFGGLIKRMTSKNVRMLMVPQNREDLLAVTEIIESGKVRVVIDRTYLFSEIPEAMRYVSEGRAKGKVVITIQQNRKSKTD